MPPLTMPPTSAQSGRTLRALLGAAVMIAVVAVPCAVDFGAVTLRGKAADAREGDGSGAGPAGAGARADPGDGGSGGGNGRVGQNQNETQRAVDPLGRSDAVLSPSQEQDLINRGWPP